MPQLFKPASNTIARCGILAAGLFVFITAWVVHAAYWSPYATNVNTPVPQPVPFSHRHHVEELGIDCRYCHAGVEKSASAGLPDTTTCMTCHSQLFKDAPLLAPVRQSLADGVPLRWNRVNKTPDFVFFDHSIHVAKGVGCTTCHGKVNEMTLTWKSQTLYMKWCLECHRQPEAFVRPREKIFDSHWLAPSNQLAAGRDLMVSYHVNTNGLIDCGRCHR